MRIIDSNKDFYDFYQNIYRDDTLTFDRRDSYNLSKEEFANYFYIDTQVHRHYFYKPALYNIFCVLLQVGYSYWMFNLVPTKTDNCGKCWDYDLNYIGTFKDYNKPITSIKLSVIKPNFFTYDMKLDEVNARMHNGAYKELRVFDAFRLVRDQNIETRHIPILKNIGVAAFIAPLDIYLALEEYVGVQVTAGERSESVGLTNNEKITNHGFDLKDSFRGKS